MDRFFKTLLTIFIILIVILVMAVLYSRYIGIKGLKTNEFKITNKKIPNNFHGIKIVQFSDIHYGSTINNEILENIVKEINILNPDIIVFTGDLFNKDIKLNDNEVNLITKNLKKLNASIGKYIITGDNDINHDYYNLVITNSDFINLDDSYDLIYNKDGNPIILSGISTNLKNKRDIKEKTVNTIEEIKSNSGIYSIVLMHEPDYINDINLNNYDLVLAGHSFGGNINIPGIKQILLPKGATEYYDDYQKIDNTDLYISSGLGTDKFTYRLFNKPSITLYRLTNK
jgi:Predicted phosphohydrolases